MPVEVKWHQEGHIIYNRFYGDVSFDDLQESNRLCNQMVVDAPTKIHMIVEITEMDSFPTQLSQFGDVIKMLSSTPNIGATMIVGANRIARFVTNVVSQLARLEFRMVDTMAEAEAILNRVII